jgi:hypothetical protein
VRSRNNRTSRRCARLAVCTAHASILLNRKRSTRTGRRHGYHEPVNNHRTNGVVSNTYKKIRTNGVVSNTYKKIIMNKRASILTYPCVQRRNLIGYMIP